MELERVAFVLLKRPEDAIDYPEDELERIQEAHLSYMDGLRQRGLLLTNGPFDGQSTESLRGICLYATSVEEARSLAEDDPAVKAGRLEVEAFTWLYPAGTVSFSG
ncbi:MAG TPA: YciI family protein [Actinomycetota bacterium]|nr:YciI family protein [Actinomycetota bacterium]